MKIALYVAELDIKGGTHKQVLRLAQYLVRQGHVVRLVTLTYMPLTTFPEFAQIDIVSIYEGPPQSRLERLLRRLAPIRLAFKLPPMDIVNIHDNRGLLFFFTAWLLRRSFSYVWQINDLHPSFRIGNCASFPRRWHQPIARGLNRLMARRVDRITVNVGKNVARVQQYLGVDAELLHCGVDLPTQEVSMSLPPMTPFRILSTGVFFRYRNYERLVEASAKAARQSSQHVALTIVGDTRYDPEYAQQVREMADAQGIQLSIKENLSDEELHQEIANCHVFAFVNIDQSWGLAVFETAARGRGVVLSNSVGAAELLSDLPGFYLVDPTSIDGISQALVSFIRNPQQCREYGKAAASSVYDMTWDKMYSSKVEALFMQKNLKNIQK